MKMLRIGDLNKNTDPMENQKRITGKHGKPTKKGAGKQALVVSRHVGRATDGHEIAFTRHYGAENCCKSSCAAALADGRTAWGQIFIAGKTSDNRGFPVRSLAPPHSWSLPQRRERGGSFDRMRLRHPADGAARHRQCSGSAAGMRAAPEASQRPPALKGTLSALFEG